MDAQQVPAEARSSHPARRPVRGAGPTVAVAFGGGGARGLAHIHVIEALDEMGIRPVAIAGSSIGAIMGACLAAGMSGRDMQLHARSVLRNRAEVLARVWKSRPYNLSQMLSDGMRMTQFDIERILKAFLPAAVPATFEELGIPLQVTATDYYGHALAVFESGDLYTALAASAAIPTIFRPVRRDGKLLIDGGIYNPVPFDLLEGKADIVMAVDVVGGPTHNSRKRPSALDLIIGSTQLMMMSITAMKLKTKRPEILLRPPVLGFRVLDFLKIETVMAETASIKDEAKRALDAAFETRAGRSALRLD